MFQGKATVLEDAEAEAAEPGMEEVRWQMGTKYAGGHGESAEPRKNESSARGRHWRDPAQLEKSALELVNPAAGRARGRNDA